MRVNWKDTVEKIAEDLKLCSIGQAPPKRVLEGHSKTLQRYVEFRLDSVSKNATLVNENFNLRLEIERKEKEIEDLKSQLKDSESIAEAGKSYIRQHRSLFMEALS